MRRLPGVRPGDRLHVLGPPPSRLKLALADGATSDDHDVGPALALEPVEALHRVDGGGPRDGLAWSDPLHTAVSGVVGPLRWDTASRQLRADKVRLCRHFRHEAAMESNHPSGGPAPRCRFLKTSTALIAVSGLAGPMRPRTEVSRWFALSIRGSNTPARR
jgi:hypothetical protein